jgi:hypothetical protein
MAQTTVALMCGVGSFLVGGDAVVVPCNHPASPSAQSAPAIVVPRIKTPEIRNVKPSMTEEGAGATHEQQAGSAKRGAGKDRQEPASTKGSGQHHEEPSSTNGNEQHQQAPSSAGGSGQQHQR